MVIFYSYVSLPEGTTGSFSQYKHRAAVVGSDFPNGTVQDCDGNGSNGSDGSILEPCADDTCHPGKMVKLLGRQDIVKRGQIMVKLW